MADKSCYEEEVLEDLIPCPDDDLQSGTATTIYYTLADHVKTLKIPKATGSNEEAGTVTEQIVMEDGKYFSKIRVMINENELKDNLTGNTGNTRLQTVFDFFVSKLEPKIQGLKRKYKNAEMIFIVPDKTGQQFLAGNKLIPAYMTAAAGTTGKGGEDNNGTAFTVTSESPLLVYTGTIPLKTVTPNP